MLDDRDWTWLTSHRGDVASPAPKERLLWAVSKTGRRATLHLRDHPFGVELRGALDGQFLSSEVVRAGHDVAAVSQHRLDGWLARGWQLEGSIEPAQ